MLSRADTDGKRILRIMKKKDKDPRVLEDLMLKIYDCLQLLVSLSFFFIIMRTLGSLSSWVERNNIDTTNNTQDSSVPG